MQQTWKCIEVLLCVLIPNWCLRAEGQSSKQNTLGCPATMLQCFWHYFLMREKNNWPCRDLHQKPLANCQPEEHIRSKCALLRKSEQDRLFFPTHTESLMTCSLEISGFTVYTFVLGRNILHLCWGNWCWSAWKQSSFSTQSHILSISLITEAHVAVSILSEISDAAVAVLHNGRKRGYM